MVRGHAQAVQKREKGVAGRAICWQHSRHETDITLGSARAPQMQCREEGCVGDEEEGNLEFWVLENRFRSISHICEASVSALAFGRQRGVGRRGRGEFDVARG